MLVSRAPGTTSPSECCLINESFFVQINGWVGLMFFFSYNRFLMQSRLPSLYPYSRSYVIVCILATVPFHKDATFMTQSLYEKPHPTYYYIGDEPTR